MRSTTTLGAMQAFADGLAVTAHNVANGNTRDFQRWSHTYTSDVQGGVRANVEAGDPLRGLSSPPTAPPTGTTGDRVSLLGEDLLSASPGSNNVDVGREMTHLLTDQRAFEANAAVIVTNAELDNTALGLLVNQKA